MANLSNLAWVFLRNDADVEVSVAFDDRYAYRRRFNLQTGRALYTRCTRKECVEFERIATADPWIAVDEKSGEPLVGFMPLLTTRTHAAEETVQKTEGRIVGAERGRA